MVICLVDWVQNILCPRAIGPAVSKNIPCSMVIHLANWVQNILCPIAIGPAVSKNIPCPNIHQPLNMAPPDYARIFICHLTIWSGTTRLFQNILQPSSLALLDYLLDYRMR